MLTLPPPGVAVVSNISNYIYIAKRKGSSTTSPTDSLYICYANCYANSMICDTCTKEFAPRRSTAKYCSAKCRVYAARNKAIAPVIVNKEDGTTLVFGNSVEKITRAITSLQFDRSVNGNCKIHGIPLDPRGKCLQKGCKYA